MLSYRTYFTADSKAQGQSVIDMVLAQVHAWLKTKRYAAHQVAPGTVATIGPDVEATLSRETAGDGSESALFVLREKNPSGTWVTQLIVHDPNKSRQSPWVWLEIDGPETTRAAVPNLARFLLEVLDARDAGLPLAAAASSLTVDEVPPLIEALVDERRRGPIFIAGSDPTLPMEPWRELISSLLRQTTGLAPGYVLDPEATARFNELVGQTHAVEPGTMRTFVLGVDFESDLDARRHRILSTASIVTDSGRRMVRVLGRVAKSIEVLRRGRVLPRMTGRSCRSGTRVRATA